MTSRILTGIEGANPATWSHARSLSILGMVGILAACAELTPNFKHQAESAEQVTGIDIHSSYPAIRRPEFEQINLLELIDPHREAAAMFPEAWRSALRRGEREGGKKSSIGLRYDLTLAAFRERTDRSSRDKKQHRNAVQDRILSVATSRCNVFKTYLRRQQATSNLWLGSMTTVAGVLGAILPGVNATRNMAGIAGALSGLQAEYNANIYNNTTAVVIAKAIDVHQMRLHNRILEHRANRDVAQYTMEAAIRDAIEYDGACSTTTGLQELNVSLDELINPGIPRAAQTIAAVRATDIIASASGDELKEMAKSGQLKSLLALTQIGARAAAEAATPDSPAAPGETDARQVLARLEEALRAGADLDKHIKIKAETVREAFEKAQRDGPINAEKPKDPNLPKKIEPQCAEQLGKALKADRSRLDSCVLSLRKPYLDVQTKLAEQALAQASDAQKRSQADADLMKSVAEATNAAIGFKQFQSDVQAFVDNTAGTWITALSKLPPEEGVLEKPIIKEASKAGWCGRNE